MIKINIIGAGRVGRTLGYLWQRRPALSIQGVYNRSLDHAKEAADWMGGAIAVPSLADLPRAEMTLIATPDQAIESVSEALFMTGHLQPGHVVLHCSGLMTSHVLSNLRKQACCVASVHPMKSFSDPKVSVLTYEGTYCAVEGDRAAVEMAYDVFEQIGSTCYMISQENKIFYHLGAVFASNYMLTLAEEALSCFQQADLDRSQAMAMMLSLMKSTLANLESTQSPSMALTGPIQRGDLATIQQHLEALMHLDADARHQLYQALGQATLKLLPNESPHVPMVRQIMSAEPCVS